MTAERERLPNRRLNETFDFEVSGLKYRCTVSKFCDGRIAEVFLSNHKAGSQADTNAKDAAIIASIALQYGVSLETIRRALLRDIQDRPSGPLGVVLDLTAAEADNEKH
jgi:hypothetical protein